jgi:hypothetical protein
MEEKKQGYTYLVEVKCKAPKGYKPRTMTYKGICFGRTQRDHSKIEEMAVAEIKARLEEKNKGIPIDVTAKATLYLSQFVLDINDIETLRLKFI